MGYVGALWKNGGFIRFHYGSCHVIPWNKGNEPQYPERWFRFETLTEAIRKQERDFPNHPLLACRKCRPPTVLLQAE